MSRLIVPEFEPVCLEAEPYWEAMQYGPAHISEVRSYREKALHDTVLVAALAIVSYPNGDVAIEKAFNQNLGVGENPSKRCAESKIISRVEERGGNIHVMFVCGTPQPDTHCGMITTTLPMCGNCHEEGNDSDAIKEESIIIPVHPDEDVYAINYFAEMDTLRDAWSTQRIEPTHYYDPGFKVWEHNRQKFEKIMLSDKSLEYSPSLLTRLAMQGKLAVGGYERAA